MSRADTFWGLFKRPEYRV